MRDFRFYNARDNRYFVATPKWIREFIALPDAAADAAKFWKSWTRTVAERVCANYPNANGLLVGPFPSDGFGLIIVNTNGELAERSGNGLTIFSQFLVDERQVGPGPFSVTVYHDRAAPLEVQVEPETLGVEKGFWVDMGVPTFGPQAVNASSSYGEEYEHNGRRLSRVSALAEVDPTWTRSLLVCVDNPHCVTFLDDVTSLASLDHRKVELKSRLTAIAFSSLRGEVRGDGLPCADGINLQWAFVGPDKIHARVFERGEGWTDSSGSSATAIACAARHLGFTKEATVRVKMLANSPLVIQFDDRTRRVKYFGLAIPEDKVKGGSTTASMNT